MTILGKLSIPRALATILGFDSPLQSGLAPGQVGWKVGINAGPKDRGMAGHRPQNNLK